MQKSRLWFIVAATLAVVVAFAALMWPTEPDSRLLRIQPTPRKTLTEVGETYRPELGGFTVRYKDFASPYRLASMFVMPGESVKVQVLEADDLETYAIGAEDGIIEVVGKVEWRWQAPDSTGLYPIHINEVGSGERTTINAFVMVPYDLDQERLRGFRVGQYRREPYRGDSSYVPPEGFVEVTRDTRDVLVSPHFTLGQFASKQESGYPKFLVLDERLILKLEWLLREINDRGFEVPTLHVMSAFRTPYYNRSIGNDTDHSQHLYGGAADVFVDVNMDGYMDDLNDDGDVTREDAEYLAEIIEEMENENRYRPFIGGLGIYSPAAHRGPFVHVDVRGSRVRW